ncbi:conserved hypothetical protein [Ricinus communis]|uniref:Uncharacterized protein n=1 Tax=Ricinus communis TaxID=3988 RepID=B9S8H6_RICCO|nr:conserved hypothetical protein [Ricinus communis]
MNRRPGNEKWIHSHLDTPGRNPQPSRVGTQQAGQMKFLTFGRTINDQARCQQSLAIEVETP